MSETIGDLNRLDCPHCGKGGLDDLWDGCLDFAGIERTTETDCGHCGAVCSVTVTCSITATAKVVKPGSLDEDE